MGSLIYKQARSVVKGEAPGEGSALGRTRAILNPLWVAFRSGSLLFQTSCRFELMEPHGYFGIVIFLLWILLLVPVKHERRGGSEVQA
jgi:hypothetical protein